MKKTVPFNHFKEGQVIYCDIGRLAALEKALTTSIPQLLMKGDFGVNFVIAGLTVGLAHHYRNAPAVTKALEEYLESGAGDLNDLARQIVNAIMASGIYGKIPENDAEDEEKNAPTIQPEA